MKHEQLIAVGIIAAASATAVGFYELKKRYLLRKRADYLIKTALRRASKEYKAVEKPTIKHSGVVGKDSGVYHNSHPQYNCDALVSDVKFLLSLIKPDPNAAASIENLLNGCDRMVRVMKEEGSSVFYRCTREGKKITHTYELSRCSEEEKPRVVLVMNEV